MSNFTLFLENFLHVISSWRFKYSNIRNLLYVHNPVLKLPSVFVCNYQADKSKNEIL